VKGFYPTKTKESILFLFFAFGDS